MNNSVAKSKRGAKELFTGLEEIRTKVILASNDMSDIERAPVSLAIATERVDRWLEGLHDNELLKGFVQRFMFPSFNAPTPAEALDFMMGILSQMARGEMLKVLTSCYGENLNGLSDDDRKSRIIKKSAELLALELSEEAVIRNAEELGLDVLRRPEADPRAVLAVKEDLE